MLVTYNVSKFDYNIAGVKVDNVYIDFVWQVTIDSEHPERSQVDFYPKPIKVVDGRVISETLYGVVELIKRREEYDYYWTPQ